MQKKFYFLYAVAVLSILTAFGIFSLVLPERTYSENENRYLDEYPSVSLGGILSGEFQEKFESAFSDQFLGRDQWMKTSTQTQKILGFEDISQVYLGKDHYYFAKTTQDTVDQKKYLKNLRYVEYLGEMTEGKTSLILAPSPGTVLHEKLPDGAPYYDAKGMYEMAETILKNTKNIDAYSVIREYAKQNQVYFRTDHHWTALGAYAAYSAYCVANKLEQHTYGYFDVKKISDAFQGTLYSKLLDPASKKDDLYAPDNVPQVQVTCDGESRQGIYDVEKLMKKDKYAYFFGGNYGEVRIDNYDKNKKEKLLIIKDSYANSFVPYVMGDYGEITMIDLRYYKQSVQGLLQQDNYDKILVLYEMSNFAQDGNLYRLVH